MPLLIHSRYLNARYISISHTIQIEQHKTISISNRLVLNTSPEFRYSDIHGDPFIINRYLRTWRRDIIFRVAGEDNIIRNNLLFEASPSTSHDHKTGDEGTR